jgi:hypothetical protein
MINHPKWQMRLQFLASCQTREYLDFGPASIVEVDDLNFLLSLVCRSLTYKHGPHAFATQRLSKFQNPSRSTVKRTNLNLCNRKFDLKQSFFIYACFANNEVARLISS